MWCRSAGSLFIAVLVPTAVRTRERDARNSGNTANNVLALQSGCGGPGYDRETIPMPALQAWRVL